MEGGGEGEINLESDIREEKGRTIEPENKNINKEKKKRKKKKSKRVHKYCAHLHYCFLPAASRNNLANFHPALAMRTLRVHDSA